MPLTITASVPLNERQNDAQYPLVFGVRILSTGGIAATTMTTQTTGCGAKACAVHVMAPPGMDTFAIAYAASIGSALPNLAPLSVNERFSALVSANGGSVAVTLQAVPAYYELDATNGSPWTGTMPLTLNFVDDSNTCTPQQVSSTDCILTTFLRGPFSNSVTLTDTDSSGQSALRLNGGAAQTSVTVSTSSDKVALVVRSGANISQAYVTPSGAFAGGEFGSAYVGITLAPWTTQDPNGLGFTCANGSCQTTGPSSVTIQ